MPLGLPGRVVGAAEHVGEPGTIFTRLESPPPSRITLLKSACTISVNVEMLRFEVPICALIVLVHAIVYALRVRTCDVAWQTAHEIFWSRLAQTLGTIGNRVVRVVAVAIILIGSQRIQPLTLNTTTPLIRFAIAVLRVIVCLTVTVHVDGARRCHADRQKQGQRQHAGGA
jgi:hypothetical protein